MAKRFTDTTKYKKPFIRSLPGAYKLLWDFLYHDCDHAGIWIVDFEIAQSYLGKDMVVSKEVAIKLFNEDESRIIELDGGKKWFIPSFIEFQYGKLSEKNRAHVAVINILKKFGLLTEELLIKPLTSPLQGAKEKDKEKDKEKEMDKGLGKSENPFDETALVPNMAVVFKDENPNYTADHTFDFPALKQIAHFICKQSGISFQPRDGDVQKVVLDNWRIISQWIPKHKHYSNLNLQQINKYIQSISTEIRNESTGNKTSGKPGSKVNGSQLDTALAKFRNKGQPAGNA